MLSEPVPALYIEDEGKGRRGADSFPFVPYVSGAREAKLYPDLMCYEVLDSWLDALTGFLEQEGVYFASGRVLNSYIHDGRLR